MKARSLSACLASKCETDCGLECGAIAGYLSEPDAGVECAECLKSKACSQAKACGSSEACDAYLRCPLAFSTEDTLQICENRADAGAALATATAFAASCATPCAIGNYWACVGHVSWPKPKSTTVTLDFTVRDFNSGNGIPGAQVAVCGVYDPYCTAISTEMTTNDAGQVSLSFSNVLNSTGQFGLNGHLQLTGPGIFPSLFYWGFPLVEAQATLYDNFVSPDEFQQLLSIEGITATPGRGFVAAAVYDCLGNPAPGTRITTSADPLPTFNTLLSAATVTGQDGILIFDNVPAGSFELTASPSAIGGKASSKATVTVQEGKLTELIMWPTP